MCRSSYNIILVGKFLNKSKNKTFATMTIFTKCLWLSILNFNLIHQSMGLADKAAYVIRNVQDHLCITAGPIIGSEKVSLFKGGIPISANCTKNAVDQQWILNAIDYSSSLRKYKIKSTYSRNFDRKLNAQIRGEFILYFRNPVQFLPVLVYGKRYYAIYDTVAKMCLESNGHNHVLHRTDCKFKTNPSQQWDFILINQARAPEKMCTSNSFWSCNQ